MCLFEDEMKPPSANLQSGLISFTCSKRSYTTTLSIRRRNTSRKAARKASAELDEQYKRLRRLLATAWRTKRSGISREMSLFM